jgi:hypothetical protein
LMVFSETGACLGRLFRRNRGRISQCLITHGIFLLSTWF